MFSGGDNGSLKGLDTNYGAGVFNKDTEAFVMTLRALPDVDSSLIPTRNVSTQKMQQPTTALEALQALQFTPPEDKNI